MQFGADFGTLVARFSPDQRQPIALAVSGGSDSTALLALTHDWASQHARKLCVFTVDHRLREDAKAEARKVAQFASSLGHDHQTLIWDTPRTSQAAARDARQRLLASAARDRGAKVLLLGHTIDDIVETLLLRRRRGLRGPFSIGPSMVSPSPVWPEGRDISLIRPLLLTPKQKLQQHLLSRNIQWSEDPSNQNANYERVKIRQHLSHHPAWVSPLSDIARTRLNHRNTLESTLGAQLTDKALIRIETSGLIHLNQASPSLDLLSILLRTAGGHDQMPRRSNLQVALSTLDEVGKRATLGGAWLQRTHTGYLIGREPGRRPPQEQSGLWDGRYQKASKDTLPIEALPFLVRETAPPDSSWQEILSARIAHIARCYQTPLLSPVQT
jgi:tRNA(Ile)-lysidine synthase